VHVQFGLLSLHGGNILMGRLVDVLIYGIRPWIDVASSHPGPDDVLMQHLWRPQQTCASPVGLLQPRSLAKCIHAGMGDTSITSVELWGGVSPVTAEVAGSNATSNGVMDQHF